MRDPSPRASNWRATGTLEDELIRQRIVGIAGIDTRAVVRHLRSRGSMKAGVFSDGALAEPADLIARVRAQQSMLGADLAGEVSTAEPYVVEPDGPPGVSRFTVAALDLGIKTNTPRNFARRGIRCHVLPASTTFEQIAELNPHGVFLSNGPGDPATADHVVALTREVLGAGIPLFGICFGNQILGRALGLSTYKMVFGHRGINIPVVDHATGRVAVTAQNHGFALQGRRANPSPPRSVPRWSATPAPTTVWSKASSSLTGGRFRCNTTRKPPPARTMPSTCSTSSWS